jgi:hypothetical protein
MEIASTRRTSSVFGDHQGRRNSGAILTALTKAWLPAKPGRGPPPCRSASNAFNPGTHLAHRIKKLPVVNESQGGRGLRSTYREQFRCALNIWRLASMAVTGATGHPHEPNLSNTLLVRSDGHNCNFREPDHVSSRGEQVGQPTLPGRR